MATTTIMPAPAKPENMAHTDWTEIKKTGQMTMPTIKAREAIRNSRGGYVIKPEEAPKAQMVMPSLDEMDPKDLKRLYLQALAVTGKKPGKQVTRAAMMSMIRSVEDSIEIVDEEPED